MTKKQRSNCTSIEARIVMVPDFISDMVRLSYFTQITMEIKHQILYNETLKTDPYTRFRIIQDQSCFDTLARDVNVNDFINLMN